MKNIIFYVFVLLALFLLVFYYVGSSTLFKSVLGGASDLVGRLQGRDNFGNLPKQYPEA